MKKLLVGSLVLVIVLAAAFTAEAGARISVGVSFGFPGVVYPGGYGYYGPVVYGGYYGPYAYYPYYAPYPYNAYVYGPAYYRPYYPAYGRVGYYAPVVRHYAHPHRVYAHPHH